MRNTKSASHQSEHQQRQCARYWHSPGPNGCKPDVVDGVREGAEIRRGDIYAGQPVAHGVHQAEEEHRFAERKRINQIGHDKRNTVGAGRQLDVSVEQGIDRYEKHSYRTQRAEAH